MKLQRHELSKMSLNENCVNDGQKTGDLNSGKNI